jgi:ADP-ribose pyrophosphatase
MGENSDDALALVHEVRAIHRGKVFRLDQERVTLPNGFTTTLEVIRHPGASATVGVLPDGRVALLRQYRHAVGRVIWEIPAGTLSPGESPDDCARRELREETGYEGDRFVKLGEMVPIPAYSDETIHLFLATELRKGTQNLDEDEVLRVEPLPFERALEMIRTNEIVDAKTIVGLTLARAYLSEAS